MATASDATCAKQRIPSRANLDNGLPHQLIQQYRVRSLRRAQRAYVLRRIDQVKTALRAAEALWCGSLLPPSSVSGEKGSLGSTRTTPGDAPFRSTGISQARGVAALPRSW